MSIQCLSFKKFEKGLLLGFASLYIEKWDVEIHGCSLFSKNGGRWINMPSKEYKNDLDETKWSPLIKFRDRNHQDVFSHVAIAAIDKFCSENQCE